LDVLGILDIGVDHADFVGDKRFYGSIEVIIERLVYWGRING
jgi:hypothetical protein